MKQISIIISYFESPRYLEIQLEHYSSFDNIEIIVIDDNSKIYPLKEDVRYKGIKINNDFPFGNEACKNVGVKESKYENIFVTDVDYILTKEGYDYIQSVNNDNNLHISYRIKKSKKNPWPPNIYYCNKKTFGDGYRFYGYYGLDKYFLNLKSKLYNESLLIKRISNKNYNNISNRSTDYNLSDFYLPTIDYTIISSKENKTL